MLDKDAGSLEGQIPEAPETTFVFQLNRLQDNNGRHVIERIPLYGVPPKHFARFVAPWSLQAMTPGGPINWQFEVPLPDAKTAAEAFDQMAEAAKKELPKAQLDMEKFVQEKMEAAQKKIALASDLPSLARPGGGPIPGLNSPGFPFPGGPKGPRR